MSRPDLELRMSAADLATIVERLELAHDDWIADLRGPWGASCMADYATRGELFYACARHRRPIAKLRRALGWPPRTVLTRWLE